MHIEFVVEFAHNAFITHISDAQIQWSERNLAWNFWPKLHSTWAVYIL